MKSEQVSDNFWLEFENEERKSRQDIESYILNMQENLSDSKKDDLMKMMVEMLSNNSLFQIYHKIFFMQ